MLSLFTLSEHKAKCLLSSASGRRIMKPLSLLPLPIKVLAVKPQCLCDTFAFHPMLGIRREDQATNIAHGC
jgi:hypothetical protein